MVLLCSFRSIWGKVKELPTLQHLIYEIRGQKVMLDSDLAKIYQVETKALNRAVKRNIGRFPPEFMFQLTAEEYESLRCQFGISNQTSQIATSRDPRGGRRFMPYVFTEHGVLMLSSVLNSQRAIDMNTMIMRAFVQMRQLVARKAPTLSEFKELKRMLLLHIDNTDNRFSEHGNRINHIIEILNNLIEKPPVKRQIGFHVESVE